MSIEINGLPPIKVHDTKDDSSVKQAQQQAPVQKETGGSSTSDTVSISDNAAQLGKIESAEVATPVVDAKRVEQIKQAINDGSFTVDPAKIADRLMQFESMLKPKG